MPRNVHAGPTAPIAQKIRPLGTPALTTRGFGHDEFDSVAELIVHVLQNTQPGTTKDGKASKASYVLAEGVADKVKDAFTNPIGSIIDTATATGQKMNKLPPPSGPSAAEQQRAELERRLRTPISGSRRVVVMSRKGGVGKTTISLALGSTFAMLRGDRVVAVDANPDAGNLAHRVAPPHDRNITDVLRDMDQITSYAALRSYTSQAAESRLEVLASDDDPRIGMALNQEDYHRLVVLLDRFYNLILLDTGTGILDSANQGLLTEADQVVLVVRSGLDGGRAGALTLDWMDAHGFDDLVARAVVVVNAQRRGAEPPDLMRRHFEKRCQHVVTVPWDDALEQGALTDMSSLRRATRDSLVDIAAAVADNFVQMGDQS